MSAWLQRSKWLPLLLLALFAVSSWRRITLLSQPQLPVVTDSGPVGTFHAHSNDSHDGRLPPEAMIAIAEQLGLDFLVLTEHNMQRAHTRSGHVQILSAGELSTPQGHAIQLGLPALVPEPIRRSKRLHQQLRSLGASSIVAHPTCPKRPWLGDYEHVGGLEIANTATSLRYMGGRYWLGLWPLLLIWPIEPAFALSQLYGRDDAALALWDSLDDAGIAGFCGTDSHGWVDPRWTMPHWLLQLSQVQPGGNLSSAALVQALQQGKFHCLAGLVAPRVQFAWLARFEQQIVGGPGDTLPVDKVDALEAALQTEVPISLRLYRDGQEVLRTDSTWLRLSDPPAGLYRIEVWLQLPGMLWGSYGAPILYSNRIRLVGERREQ